MLALPPQASPFRDATPAVAMPSTPRRSPLSPPSSSPAASGRSSKARPHRPIRPNALLQRLGSATDARERRRGLFLKRVRQDGEDRRWAARGGDDEIMRSIFLNERRRWEASLARAAPGAEPAEEELVELAEAEVEADGVLPPDDLEQDVDTQSQDHAAEALDEDEYDRLFLELSDTTAFYVETPPPPPRPQQSDLAGEANYLAQHAELARQHPQTTPLDGDADMMDMDTTGA